MLVTIASAPFWRSRRTVLGTRKKVSRVRALSRFGDRAHRCAVPYSLWCLISRQNARLFYVLSTAPRRTLSDTSSPIRCPVWRLARAVSLFIHSAPRLGPSRVSPINGGGNKLINNEWWSAVGVCEHGHRSKSVLTPRYSPPLAEKGPANDSWLRRSHSGCCGHVRFAAGDARTAATVRSAQSIESACACLQARLCPDATRCFVARISST